MPQPLQPGPHLWLEPSIGLELAIYVDDMSLGPAVGGTRTRTYQTIGDALADAQALSRAMSHKCALAGLDAGGAKLVVNLQPGCDRQRIFERVGEIVESYGGGLITGGDFGTNRADVAAMASRSSFIHEPDAELGLAAGRGLLRCIEAALRMRNRSVDGVVVAVQGAGVIGAACARALAGAGAQVIIADLNRDLASELAASIGASVCEPSELLSAPADVLSPCALGGVIDESAVSGMKAWALVGGANNIVANQAAHEALAKRGVVHVPDIIASAGAVTHGISRGLMKVEEPMEWVDRLGEVAYEVISRSASEAKLPIDVAREMARRRIEG